MIVIINYFNNSIKIFNDIVSINDGSDKDYILVDTLNNDIRISRQNVEYIMIDKTGNNESIL